MFENFIYSTMTSAFNKGLVGLTFFVLGLAVAAWLWHRFRDELYRLQSEKSQVENEIRKLSRENTEYENSLANPVEKVKENSAVTSSRPTTSETVQSAWAQFPNMNPNLASLLTANGVSSPTAWNQLSPLNKQRLEDQLARKGLTKNWIEFRDRELGSVDAISSAGKAIESLTDTTGAMAASKVSGITSGRKSSVRPEGWEVTSKKLKPRFSAEDDKENSGSDSAVAAVSKPVSSETPSTKSSVSASSSASISSSSLSIAGTSAKSPAKKQAWEIDTKRKMTDRFSAEDDEAQTFPFAGANSEINDSVATPGSETPAKKPRETHYGGPTLEFPRVSNDEPVNWLNIKGVDPKLSSEFEAMGIKNFEQLESLSLDDRRKLERHLSSRGIGWDWSQVKQWKSASTPPSFKIPEADGEQVDWVAASGIDNRYATEFEHLGIRSFEQLSMMGVEDRQKFESHLKERGLNWNWAWLNGWKNSVNRSKNVGATTSRPIESKEQPPVISTLVPAFRDDLTLLDGVEGPQAKELQKMGIYNFHQLHAMHHADRKRLLDWFRKRGWHLNMDQWRVASDGNVRNPTIDEIRQRSQEILQHRTACGLGGGDRIDWEQAEWELRGNPIFAYGVPNDVDDFAFTQSGIGPEARDELYRMGLYNAEQVNSLNQEARKSLTKWFEGPRFGVNLAESFGWLESNFTTVPNETDFGNIYSRRPSRIDSLTNINGIGTATERDLHRIGIYQFDQIALWTKDQAIAVANVLDLEDRIVSDEWVAQAKKFMRHN